MKKDKDLAGKQYRTDDEVISAVEEIFKDQDESFFTMGIQALLGRSVWTAGETMLKNKPHLVNSTIAS